MKFNLKNLGLFSVTCSLLLTACKHGASGDFETDKASGIEYRFINHNESGTKPAAGDYATVQMLFKNDKDSVCFTTIGMRKRPGDTAKGLTIPLKFNFSGCLEQAITLMAVGDSAQFKIKADSLYLKQFRYPKLPPFIRAGSFVTFNVKLISFQNQQQVQQLQQQQMMKMQAEMAKRKDQEAADITKYLADNKYTSVKPTKDSLFFLKRTAGKGKAIKEGDSVEVEYTGMTLDGKVFDGSKDHGHGPFKIAWSPSSQGAIKGWILALGEMHQGDKATILLPSAIAYGPRGAGGVIPPYAPLVFEMEVTKVWK
ncbi:MAG TPA: FKBP-type peptidyl-prolyl cis-trans isomerase [Bacteroidia bacterium]|jgi:FKBP-type peptidyl-prolyl cis-trans isomerase FkpA|nr:FKBP-type peptidyl-prolyl cis-trans isomerase [Bacteroidia bacterium]